MRTQARKLREMQTLSIYRLELIQRKRCQMQHQVPPPPLTKIRRTVWMKEFTPSGWLENRFCTFKGASQENLDMPRNVPQHTVCKKVDPAGTLGKYWAIFIASSLNLNLHSPGLHSSHRNVTSLSLDCKYKSGCLQIISVEIDVKGDKKQTSLCRTTQSQHKTN